MDQDLIKQLLDTVVQQRDQMTQQQNQISDLVNALQAIPGVRNPLQVQVQAPNIDANVQRADNVQKISLNLRKSTRVKIYKGDSDIHIYLRKFGEEVKTLKQMVGIANDLSRDEYVPIFRASLDFHVIERVEQVFKKDPQAIKTWENISIADLHQLMKNEFG